MSEKISGRRAQRLSCNMEMLKNIVLLVVPRILGFIDGNSESKTYGCCDRYYWHYKLHDLPNARFQEICLLLTLLHETDFEGNIYYKKRRVLEWIFASISFWLIRANKDGSSSEVYPYERSFCATSFSTFAASESLLLLLWGDENIRKKTLSFIDNYKVMVNLEKTAAWIVKNFNSEVANQMAAAVISLHNISLLTGNQIFRTISGEKYKELKTDFAKYGFCPEYGGFDIGYQSITNSCLALYGNKLQDCEDIRDMVSVACGTLNERVDSFGNYDSNSTSRHTQFLYTYGFSYVKSPAMDKILNGLALNKIISPLWMDDRYCIALAIDYLQTYVGYKGCSRGLLVESKGIA